MADTGYQPDGSYIPCPECRYVPPVDEDEGPGCRISGQRGTIHESDCPTVPNLSQRDREELWERLREMDRCRGRAAVAARNYWVG